MANRYHDAGPAASGQKVFLATTVYDKPDASYVFSIARSREALTAAGIQSSYYLLQGNCHVDDARNDVVREFLESDCTELVFLDADVSWEPEALVALCKVDRDLCGGVYPYRRDGGGERMPYRPLDTIEADEDGLIEVEGLPTGFMRIKRHVLETMAATAKRFLKDTGSPLPVIFERDYFGGGRRGGDIRFCMVWREMGGKLFALPELRLGHAGHILLQDSLGASLRRQNGMWLRWMAIEIASKRDTFITYAEAFKAQGNKWAADASVLQMLAGLARSADGPILEIGSGLSTIVAAAAGGSVWCVEHNPDYADAVETMAAEAGVSNIAVVSAPLKDGWYALSDEDKAAMPGQFALAFVDGPPRTLGDRMRFFEEFGNRCRVILCDDADDKAYALQLRAWAASWGRSIKIDGRAAIILPKG